MPWVGTWTVPASYPLGLVNFKVLVKTTDASGSASSCRCRSRTSQLTITHDARRRRSATAPAAAAAPTHAPTTTISLYVDTRQRHARPSARPSGRSAAPRRTSTSAASRSSSASGASTSRRRRRSRPTTSTRRPHSIPGVAAPLTLNYGAHGATGNKVFFWSAPWIVPATFPLGDVTSTSRSRPTPARPATFDYPITIIP